MTSDRRPPINIVVADAGPLISLAAARRLDLLECFDRPVKVLDIVKEECLRKTGAPGEAELQDWFSNSDNVAEIVPSPFKPLYVAARALEIAGTDPFATEGLGDAAISWLIAKVPGLYGHNVTSLVLTEDASFGNTQLGRNVHVLSTRPFLATLQSLGVIPSAAAVLKDIAEAGRVVARYQADRPALVGPKGTRRTQWTEAVQTRRDRDPASPR